MPGIDKSEIERKLREARAKVDSKISTSQSTQPPAPSEKRSGLSTEIHPALMALQAGGDAAAFKSKVVAPKFSTVLANAKLAEQEQKKREKKLAELEKKRAEENQKQVMQKIEMNYKQAEEDIAEFTKNPYFDPKLSVKSAAAPKTKGRKMLSFVPQGKYVEEAERMRAQVHMDRINEQIAEKALKAGGDDEILVADLAVRVCYLYPFYSSYY